MHTQGTSPDVYARCVIDVWRQGFISNLPDDLLSVVLLMQSFLLLQKESSYLHLLQVPPVCATSSTPGARGPVPIHSRGAAERAALGRAAREAES